MSPQQLNVGDVVQINPNSKYAMFAGCFLTVTEPKSFGCQGYVQCLGDDQRRGGQAFLRPRFEDIELIGRAVFMIDREEAAQ
jgi:hypothetical protein